MATITGRAQKVTIAQPLFRVPRWMLWVQLVLRILSYPIIFLAKRPALTALIAVVLILPLGLTLFLVSGGAVVCGLLRWKSPVVFTRWIYLPALSYWQSLYTYRRGWVATMATCRLTVSLDGMTAIPTLKKVVSTEATDRLVVRILRGQTPAEFQEAAEKIAYSFGYRHARVYTKRPDAVPIRVGRLAWVLRWIDGIRWADKPAIVHIVIARTDPLTEIVRPFPIQDTVDFEALPVALTSSMEVYKHCLLARHLLIAGASRRGKGSVIWSLIRALAPAVKTGLAQLWVIDPKGGMELAFGKNMFTRFAYQSFEEMADLLEQAVTEMQARQLRLAGAVRVHTPSTKDPLIVVMIDEIAALTAYLSDTELRKRIESALGMLLSQGAGVGVVLVGAVQDPRKEILTYRDLFLTRILLGVTDASHVDMVLGDGARRKGAHADWLDIEAKGVGYALPDGAAEPVQVRFTYLDDAEIKRMAAAYPAPVDPKTVTTSQPKNGNGSKPGEFIPASLLTAFTNTRNPKANGSKSNGHGGDSND